MSEPEFVTLSDGLSIADEQWYYGHSQNGAVNPVIAEPLVFTSLQDFIAVEEPSSEPLLGTSTETLLPADGMLLMYGDGGAGKTTLTIDAVYHLASGIRWLGLEVQRPIRTLLIENEGPRGKFRQMLSEKSANWSQPIEGNVSVLEEPWTRFTLKDEGHRQGLAQHVDEQEVDLVVMGPLVTLGMVGGGTPDEVSAFEELLRTLKGLVKRVFALWVVHHENKAGDVSGAWERVPDTLCHVQARGNGHTALHWRKARWSSEYHGTSSDLLWSDGRSFSLVVEEERDTYEEMLAAFRHADAWRTAKEAGKLIKLSENEARKVLAELVRRGEMLYEIGPKGRHATAHCWRLRGALERLAHLSAPTDSPANGGAPEYPPSPFRERGTQRRSVEADEKAALEPSAPIGEHDDGIPF